MNVEELRASTFRFRRWKHDKETNDIVFSYDIDTSSKTFSYSEALRFPPEMIIDSHNPTLRRILDNLAVALGTSYYKGFLSSIIILEHTELSSTEASYWNTVYKKGLGELLLRNNLEESIITVFDTKNTEIPLLSEKKLEEETMLGFGGGKDSYVSYEELKKQNKPATFYLIETNKTYAALRADIEQLELPCVYVARQIDTQFIEDTRTVPLTNGHIPITAIYSWIGILIAFATSKKYISLGNEASTEENTIGTVNHQWSKTEEHEKLLQKLISSHIHPELTFFSPIRTFSSIRVARELAAYPQYLARLSSCSKQFVQDNHNEKRWCNECAKCLGTFILLAPWLGVDKTTEISGENLLQKESLLPILEELRGIRPSKPFECVATVEETNLCIEAIETKNNEKLH